MLIGVPKELAAGEKRVATVPDVVEKLQQVCRELFTLLARDPDQQEQAA